LSKRGGEKPRSKLKLKKREKGGTLKRLSTWEEVKVPRSGGGPNAECYYCEILERRLVENFMVFVNRDRKQEGGNRGPTENQKGRWDPRKGKQEEWAETDTQHTHRGEKGLRSSPGGRTIG